MSSFLSLILIYVNDDLFIQISGHEATKNFESIFYVWLIMMLQI